MSEKVFLATDHNKVITVGLPLPSFVEHVTDVSEPTRNGLEIGYNFARDQGLEVFELKKRGINVSANHNDLVNGMKGDWLLICGSDHTFPPYAIYELWKATQEPPYPKIIGGVMPYRNPPHAYVFGHLNKSGECVYSSAPFKHFHPGITMSGEIMKVDVIGSGFTIYHRSVFDAVPMPWFSYEPIPIQDRLFYETLEDLPDFLDGDGVIETDKLKEKARNIRRILGQSRRCIPFGPDYGFCLKARDYGFDSYVHWGLEIHHSTFVPINTGHFIAAMQQPDQWFRYAIGGEEYSIDGLKNDIEMLNTLNFKGFSQEEIERLVTEYKQQKQEASA